MRWLIAYLATAAAMLAMDFCWLTGTAAFYRSQIGPLLLAQPRLGPAAAFYLIYVAGVVLFVVMPSLSKTGWHAALAKGAAFGLVTYATYDLTNLATLKGFPDILVAADLTWGCVITAVAATVGRAAARRFG